MAVKNEKISVVVISGDGIGPEITAGMIAVVDKALSFTSEGQVCIDWISAGAGLSTLEKEGVALPDQTIELLRQHRVGIKGPTTTPTGIGHKSVNVSLRQQLDLYANVRPVKWFPGIETPIHRPENVDLVIFRENTEDVYAGIEFAAESDKAKELYAFIGQPASVSASSAFGIKPVSERASRRIMRRAIKYALACGRRRITVVHKGNIMKLTEGAFRDWAFDEAKLLLKSAPEGKILVQERIADAMFQDLLLKPSEHEVLVTLNLNGDYLSDAAAALVGGLGLAAGANFGDEIALFEAVHGSAPDIAGKNLANPSALILSAAMMLEHLGHLAAATRIRSAIHSSIQDGAVTADLFTPGSLGQPLSCSDFVAELLARVAD